MLKSLDAANSLAVRLKQRSEQMLDILATEISTLHKDLDTRDVSTLHKDLDTRDVSTLH